MPFTKCLAFKVFVFNYFRAILRRKRRDMFTDRGTVVIHLEHLVELCGLTATASEAALDPQFDHLVESSTQRQHLHKATVDARNRPRNIDAWQQQPLLFQTNFIITQLAMFYLLLRFDHHRRPSSGTECSVVTAR